MVKIVPSEKPNSSTKSEAAKTRFVEEKFRLPAIKQRRKFLKNCFSKTVFHPESFFRLSWDILLLLIIIYQALTIPYFICFNDEESYTLQTIELTINIFFCADILISFNTGFYQKGSLVLKRSHIMKDYLRLWFWIDLVSTVPYTYFIEGVYTENASSRRSSSVYNAPKVIRIVRIVRFLRVLRLLRLAKLTKVLLKIEDHIASHTLANVFVLLKLMFVTFFAAHWLACLWFFIGDQDGEMHPITWVTQAGIEDDSSYVQYVTSLYWAFTTVATVGYGDILPITVPEKILAMATMVISSGVFAYTLGSIGSLLSKQTELQTTYREISVSTNRYMKEKGITKNLQYRVKRYLEYVWEEKMKNKIDEKELVTVLSMPLRIEILSFINAKIIRTCPVFDAFEEHFISHLTRAIEQETYAPGDSILKEGEMTSKIFYITNGKIEIFHQTTQTSLAILEEKCFFGEIAFFLARPRAASARCQEFCDMLSLNRKDYLHYLEKFPEAMLKATEIYEKCLDGDYSAIQVKCYICEEIGHVATRCPAILINLDQEESRDRWIYRNSLRNFGRSDHEMKTNFQRKKKRIRKKEFAAFNEVWKNNMRNHLGELDIRQKEYDEFEEDVRFNELGRLPRKKPQYTIFYSSGSESFDYSDIKVQSIEELDKLSGSVINEQDEELEQSERSKVSD